MGIFDNMKSWFEKEDNLEDYQAGQDVMLDDLRDRQEAYDKSVKDAYEAGMDSAAPREPEWGEQMEYDPRSDKYIEIVVKDKLKDKTANERDKIVAEYSAKEAGKAAGASVEKSKYDSKVDKISSAVDDAKIIERNSALQRGLMNSSILSESVGEREATGMAAESAARAEYKDAIDRIDGDIVYLEQAKKLALDSHNIKSAEAIINNIKVMKKERDAINNKADSYNADVEKRKLAYEDKVVKARNDYAAQQSKLDREVEAKETQYGYTGLKKKEYDRRFNVAVNYYNSLPKKTAIKLIESSPELRNLLGMRLNDLVRVTNARAK